MTTDQIPELPEPYNSAIFKHVSAMEESISAIWGICQEHSPDNDPHAAFTAELPNGLNIVILNQKIEEYIKGIKEAK